jgi:anti-sigma factor RsiW
MSVSQDVNCQRLVELVTDYLEGALPAELAARFEEHLTACEACTLYVEQMREVQRMAGKIEVEALAPETRDGLLLAFRGWKEG